MIVCPVCKGACRLLDDACGSCGAALARLVVKDGRQRISPESHEIVCSVENHGVVDAAFVVRRIDARSFPPWLVETPELDQAVVVAAGGSVDIKLVVDGSKLPLVGQTSAQNPGRVVVPLVTSTIRFERGQAVRKVLAVELAIGGRAALHPRHARYRFVPVERLRAPGSSQAVSHVVVVENDGGHPIRLNEVRLTTSGASVISMVPQLLPVELAPGARHNVTLLMKPVDVDAGPVEFGASVEAVFDDGSVRVADVSGIVGRGPDVVVVDVPVVHTGGRPRRAAVVVKNPGHLPVRLERPVIVEDESGGWLRLREEEAGGVDGAVVLAPGESRRIELVVEPELRSARALEQPWGEKKLVLRHDGWQPDDKDRVIDVVVAAELGRTRTLDEATLGVDFGTSNSSVSLFHGPTGTLHALPLDRESGRESLASLMFFT